MYRIEQHTGDACTVAAISMLTKTSYVEVLEAAMNTGYVPLSGIGAQIAEVLTELNIEFGFKVKRIENLPAIVAVASINNPGGRHAVVVTADRQVLDPSSKKQVSYQHCLDTVSFSYYLI